MVITIVWLLILWVYCIAGGESDEKFNVNDNGVVTDLGTERY